jgi:twitching motility protein PilT
VEIIDLLKIAIKNKASDLHIVPTLKPMMRVDGDLEVIEECPALSPTETNNIICNILSPEEKQSFKTNLVLDLAINFPNLGNFRASVLHQLNGIAAVIRLIPEAPPTFEELKLPNVFKRLLQLSHGFIIVTGPTGSGKSTTLAAMVDYINTNTASHIITIEDPIEYIHTSKKSAINQLQVGRDTPDMQTALRAALRQDPDVILLGEMRDLETIRLALTAAETGHLVLASLHARSAPMAISRIIDAFNSDEKNRVRNLLSETLEAIIYQTLVKKNSGGRIAAFEIMLANPAIRHQIRQDLIAQMSSTIQTNGDIGMCTLDQYLQELVAKRFITVATARDIAANQGLFN